MDDVEAAATAPHRFALDAVLAVLGPVHVNIRFQFLQERDRIGFIKDVNVVDHPQSQQHLSTTGFGHDGPGGAFVTPDRCVTIQSNDQNVSSLTRFVEDVEVTGVQVRIDGECSSERLSAWRRTLRGLQRREAAS